jgi:hypothetical protein
MTALSQTITLKKRHIADTIAFALSSLPQTDQHTLEKFLALVNIGGSHGALNLEEVVNKMRLTMKYVPQPCPETLLIVADLLEVPLPKTEASQSVLPGPPPPITLNPFESYTEQFTAMRDSIFPNG